MGQAMCKPPAVRYLGVICDLDGTLIDSSSIAPACVNLTLGRHGMPSREEASLQRFAWMTCEDIWTELIPDELKHLRTDCGTHYRRLYRDTLLTSPPLFADALAVLEALQSASIRVAILSNRENEEVQALGARTGIAKLAVAVIGLSDVTCAKPNAIAFETSLAPVFRDLPRDRVLMCGDSSVDIMFARNAGIASCWARYGYGDGKECEDLQPEHVIDRIDGLRRVVMECE